MRQRPARVGAGGAPRGWKSSLRNPRKGWGKRGREAGTAPGVSLNTQASRETNFGGQETAPLSTRPAEAARRAQGSRWARRRRSQGMRGPRRTAGERRAGTFLRLNGDVGRGRLGAALALLAALAVDGVVRLQLSVRLLRAGHGPADPVPRLPVGTARLRPPPGSVVQQVGAGPGGLRGWSHLGLAWRGESRVTPPALSAGIKAWSDPRETRESGPQLDTWWPGGDADGWMDGWMV